MMILYFIMCYEVEVIFMCTEGDSHDTARIVLPVRLSTSVT